MTRIAREECEGDGDGDSVEAEVAGEGEADNDNDNEKTKTFINKFLAPSSTTINNTKKGYKYHDAAHHAYNIEYEPAAQ